MWCETRGFPRSKERKYIYLLSGNVFPCGYPSHDTIYFFYFFNRPRFSFRRSVCRGHCSFRELCMRKHLTQESRGILRRLKSRQFLCSQRPDSARGSFAFCHAAARIQEQKSSGQQVIVEVYSLAALCSQPRRISIHCWKLPFGRVNTFWNLERKKKLRLRIWITIRTLWIFAQLKQHIQCREYKRVT